MTLTECSFKDTNKRTEEMVHLEGRKQMAGLSSGIETCCKQKENGGTEMLSNSGDIV